MTAVLFNFVHQSTLFPYIEFKRSPHMAEKTEHTVRIEIKIVDNSELPKQLQVNIHVATEPTELLNINIQAVGLFQYIGEGEPSKRDKMNFIRQRALHIVWASTRDLVRRTTVEMGMKALDLHSPSEFDLDEFEKKYLDEE